MKHIKDIKNKLDWEKYYDSDFDWNDYPFYKDNKLSEDFIREFQDKINWKTISATQKLSEEFIIEFKDKVDWEYISKYQKLSKEFKKELNKIFYETD